MWEHEPKRSSVTTKPKCLSYNNCIKNYDLSLLTPYKITVNHLLSMSPIFADLSDAFGHLILHPQTALSCQIFLYKSKKDSLPTLDLTEAIVDKNNEPVLYPLVYSSSSFGTKDLPMIFGYSMTQCVPFFTKFSLTSLKKLPNDDSEDKRNTNNSLTEEAQQLRLDMVDKILCSA